MSEEVVEIKRAFALFGAAIADGEQPGEPSPGIAIARIDEDVGGAVGKHQAAARMIAQLEIVLALDEMGAHHAGDRITIGEPKPGEREMTRLYHQLLGMRGAAQEGEIRGDGKLDIRVHDNSYSCALGGCVFIYGTCRRIT